MRRNNNSSGVDFSSFFSGQKGEESAGIAVISQGVTYTPKEYATRNGNGVQPETGQVDSDGENPVGIEFMKQLLKRAPKRRKRKSPVANA